jgi:hypothetical protein
VCPDAAVVNTADGDPYQKQINECVELISQEVRKQLASSTQRPMPIAAKTGIRLAGGRMSESSGVVGAVQRLFGQSTGAATTAGAEGNFLLNAV